MENNVSLNEALERIEAAVELRSQVTAELSTVIRSANEALTRLEAALEEHHTAIDELEDSMNKMFRWG
jgi:DNA repair ATPase RecN